MLKFSSQRCKKRKFHGNGFTSKQGVNKEELVLVESTSSGSTVSPLHCQEEAKECSASYRKFVTNAGEEKPEPKVHDKFSEENSPAITGFRFFDVEVLSSVLEQLSVATVAISAFCWWRTTQSGRDVPRLCSCCVSIAAGNFPFVIQKSTGRAMK